MARAIVAMAPAVHIPSQVTAHSLFMNGGFLPTLSLIGPVEPRFASINVFSCMSVILSPTHGVQGLGGALYVKTPKIICCSSTCTFLVNLIPSPVLGPILELVTS